jgi:hypothetical protein
VKAASNRVLAGEPRSAISDLPAASRQPPSLPLLGIRDPTGHGQHNKLDKWKLPTQNSFKADQTRPK